MLRNAAGAKTHQRRVLKFVAILVSKLFGGLSVRDVKTLS